MHTLKGLLDLMFIELSTIEMTPRLRSAPCYARGSRPIAGFAGRSVPASDVKGRASP